MKSWMDTLSLSIVTVTVFLSAKVSGTRIKDRVYHDIDTKEISACFRRLNGTTSIGCTSHRSGNVGVLMYLDTLADIDKLRDVTFSPYIVLVNPEIFSSSLMTELESTGHVTGVVLPSVTGGRWEGKVPPAGYSDDSLCPNSETSTSDECNTENPWNKPGSGLMWKSFKFPIFYLHNTTTTDNLYTCYLAHNNLATGMTWPLCSVQLSSNMHATRDSETCVRRSNMMNNLTPQKFCDPLNDVSLHYFVSSRNRTLENGDVTNTPPASVIAVTARLDTLNMFDQAEIGFDSPSTGIVALLATAKMVSQKMSTLSYRDGVSNIMFLLINGEAFENTGSSRLVYDMEQGDFPQALDLENTDTLANGTQATLNLTNIRSLIELGQLSNKFSNNLYMHTVNNPAGEVGQLEKFSRLNNLTTKISTRSDLPPSSAQTFLTSTPSLHTVFLSNFDTTYSNPVYHSVYDTALYHGYNHTQGPTQEIVTQLSKVAVVVAQTVISLATDKEVELNTEEVSDLINDLLQCYTVTANCSMFHEANSNVAGFSFPNHPFPQYVGVNPSPHTVFTKQVLQLLTGEKITSEEQKEGKGKKSPDEEESEDVAAQKAACLANNSGQNVYSYTFLVGEGCYNGSRVTCGSCYKTTVGQTQAGSPAFLEGVVDTYDWASGKYPTWTESIWKEISGRSFLQGDPRHEQVVLGVGIGVFLVSLLSVWWVEKNAVLLFPQSGCEYRLGANIAT